MEQQNDDGLPGFNDCLCEVVLVAEEVEVVAITQMRRGPGFARGLLVFSQYEQDHVGLTSYLDSFLNALCVERGISEHHLVGVPVGRRFSDLAAFGEEHFATRAYFVFDTLQDADAASWIVAVAAEMHLACVRTDDGDAPVF